MNKNNTTPIVLFLGVLLLLDFLIIGGILWKGHANFIELYKHLKK
jgi:hypothetical protein